MAASHRLIYVTEVDITLDNGRGINEREFVRTLLDAYWPEVVCVLPKPARRETLFDARIEYVVSHGHGVGGYGPHVVSTFRRIVRLCRDYPVQALIGRLEVSPLIPFAVSRLVGIPVILKTLAAYQPFVEELSVRGTRQRVAQRMLRPMFRSTIKRALCADTVSPTLAEWQRFTFGISEARLKVIPNCANLVAFSPGDRAESRRRLGLEDFDRIVGYVGTLSPGRDLDSLIRGFVRLPNGGKSGLVLVGDGPDRSRLEVLASDCGLRRNVVFTGAIPYDKVPDYMRAFDVGVDLTVVPMPMRGETLYASFSQKIPQYLACGLPVVAWDVADNGFLQSEGVGALARLGDVAGVTAALQRLLGASGEEARSRGRRARTFAEQHRSTEKSVRERLDWWRSMVDSSSGQ